MHGDRQIRKPNRKAERLIFINATGADCIGKDIVAGRVCY